MATADEYEKVVAAAEEAFKRWRTVPGPKRGEIVRRIGNAMREHKDALGRLITLEMGKIVQEGWARCKGASTSLISPSVCRARCTGSPCPGAAGSHHARAMAPWHRPDLTAFNFPMAVWA